MIPIWGSWVHVTPYSPNCKSRRSVYATAMCTMLVVLFYLHQKKENYRMMGAFTRKSLVKVESKKRKKNLGFNGLKN